MQVKTYGLQVITLTEKSLLVSNNVWFIYFYNFIFIATMLSKYVFLFFVNNLIVLIIIDWPSKGWW